jgi:CBS domain-containing protein
MICPYCNQENIEGVEECVNCGHSLAGIDLPGGLKGKAAPAFMHESLARLPKREPVSVGAADPVGLAVRLMQTRSTGCILVKDDAGKVAGIITGWDLLQKVAGQSDDLNARSCQQIMTPEPICLSNDDTVATALNVMSSGGFRHVPIIGADGQPSGVIDVGDLFRDISLHLV